MLEFCMIQLFSLFFPLVYRKATVVSCCLVDELCASCYMANHLPISQRFYIAFHSIYRRHTNRQSKPSVHRT